MAVRSLATDRAALVTLYRAALGDIWQSDYTGRPMMNWALRLWTTRLGFRRRPWIAGAAWRRLLVLSNRVKYKTLYQIPQTPRSTKSTRSATESGSCCKLIGTIQAPHTCRFALGMHDPRGLAAAPKPDLERGGSRRDRAELREEENCPNRRCALAGH